MRIPGGLANGSDQVGRNYMRHNNMALMALSKEPNPTRFQKTLALNEWYLGPTTGTTRWVASRCWGSPTGRCCGARRPAGRPSGRSSCPARSLELMAHHAVDFWLSNEDLPRPENRITIDREGTIRLAVDKENNIEGLKRLRKKLESMLSDLGMHDETHHRNVYLYEGMDVAATAHQAGHRAVRLDPETSVLDIDCRAHELDNLYVVDSSFFPSIGAVNPTLTIIANALRVGEHLLTRLG